MIAVEHVSKLFAAGRVTALDDVSFAVGRGEVVGFLGPNGAGKTTALRILAGFLAPDAGRARVEGIDVAAEPLAARRRIGYLPESFPLYDEMRVREYLAFRARLKGLPHVEARRRIDAVIELAGLGEVRERLIARLSRGFRQRVGLADTLLARPPVLLLDEPATGLDPNQVRELRALIRELGRDHTVLLSSHVLPEVEAVSSRVVILVRGRVVAVDRPAALRAALAAEGVLVSVPPGEVEAAVAALGEGASILDAAAGRLRSPLAPAEAARRVTGARLELLELRAEERTLEDVFAEVTR